ncbi:MAG: hypothetical protein RL383_1123 [Actinomycetota bacterium]|jgi:hypothetical protein
MHTTDRAIFNYELEEEIQEGIDRSVELLKTLRNTVDNCDFDHIGPSDFCSLMRLSRAVLGAVGANIRGQVLYFMHRAEQMMTEGIERDKTLSAEERDSLLDSRDHTLLVASGGTRLDTRHEMIDGVRTAIHLLTVMDAAYFVSYRINDAYETRRFATLEEARTAGGFVT